MNRLRSFLTVALVATAALVTVPQAAAADMITNALGSRVWTVPASNGATVAVNMTAAQAPWVPVGATGFGVTINAYATNAAHTTNTWFTLELGVGSTHGVLAITNNNLTVCYLPRGVATNTYHTNFVLNTSALLGNVTHARVKDCMSTNGVIGGSLAGNLFIREFLLNSR